MNFSKEAASVGGPEIGWYLTAAPITSAGRLSPRGTSSGHKCFLAVKPNQPEEDGEYGVPDVALPNVALPISHRQLPACHIKSPQSARPLIRGDEREANGSKQDKCRDHRQTFLLQRADYAPIRSMRLRPENSN
jgi:hypothetical protein